MMLPQKACLTLPVANPTGKIGQLREEELPVVRVIVPPDPSDRVFEDDLDPGDLVFDGNLTPMLVWHERYPVGRGWRSGWVLSYDTDGKGNPDDYIVGLGLSDVDAAVAQAREYLRSVGYPAAGWPCRPTDGRPIITSPGTIFLPSTIFRRSTIPTIVPATSSSPTA